MYISFLNRQAAVASTVVLCYKHSSITVTLLEMAGRAETHQATNHEKINVFLLPGFRNRLSEPGRRQNSSVSFQLTDPGSKRINYFTAELWVCTACHAGSVASSLAPLQHGCNAHLGHLDCWPIAQIVLNKGK